MESIIVPTYDADWWNAIKNYPEAEKNEITVERLVKDAQMHINHELCKNKPLMFEWLKELYLAAMDIPELAVGICSGQIPIFLCRNEMDTEPLWYNKIMENIIEYFENVKIIRSTGKVDR